MMPGVLTVYIALVVATFYPRGTEPLAYRPALTLAGAVVMALAAGLAQAALTARFLTGWKTAARQARARYARATPLVTLLILVAYTALVYLGHWPLLIDESLERAWPWPAGTGLAAVDAVLRFALTAVFLALVLAPLALALGATWIAQHPAERVLRGGPLPLDAWLRFRSQTLFAFGLLPAGVLVPIESALSGVPVWRRELEVYPAIGWVAGAALFLAVFALFPLMLRLGFGARPVPPGPLRDRLDALCTRAGFRCRNLLIWDTLGTRTVNAFIAGLVPRLRFVFFTDTLLERLAPDEVEAVLAHEIGHAACRHLRWYGILTVGFVAVAAAVMTGVQAAFGDALLPQVIAEAALMAAFLVGVLGALSRRFETEADLYAARLIGDPLRFAAALAKVVRLNGVPLSRGSWRHPRPASRIAFLTGVAQLPQLETRFLRTQRRILAGAAAVVLAGVAGAWVAADGQMREAPDRWRTLERREAALRLWEEGDALAREGRDAAAAARLRQASELDPANARLLAALGDRLLRLGQAGEARLAWTEAERLGPRDLRLRQHLAMRLGY
jgi:Zn-dependent protease with chaperone function